MPIKRNIALQPLSRQHHNGLLFCLLLGKGVKKKAAIEHLQHFIARFRENELEVHFAKEERWLLPLASQHAELAPLLSQMYAEHILLCKLLDDIERAPNYNDLSSLHTLLEKHIRFEERVLFIAMEKLLSASELATIQQALHKQVHASNCMNYPIKFWEK